MSSQKEAQSLLEKEEIESFEIAPNVVPKRKSGKEELKNCKAENGYLKSDLAECNQELQNVREVDDRAIIHRRAFPGKPPHPGEMLWYPGRTGVKPAPLRLSARAQQHTRQREATKTAKNMVKAATARAIERAMAEVPHFRRQISAPTDPVHQNLLARMRTEVEAPVEPSPEHLRADPVTRLDRGGGRKRTRRRRKGKKRCTHKKRKQKKTRRRKQKRKSTKRR